MFFIFDFDSSLTQSSASSLSIERNNLAAGCVAACCNRDMRVPLGAGDAAMAEHFLNVSDIRAVIQHRVRHRVPEQVARATFSNVGAIKIIAYRPAHAIRR